MPISIRTALPCMPLRLCTDEEWETLLHVVLASDVNWDSTSLDCEGQVSNETWFDAQSLFPDGPADKDFDEFGNHRHVSNQELFCFDAKTCIEPDKDEIMQTFVEHNIIATKTNEPKHELMRPLFNWLLLDIIAFQLSTKCARTPVSAAMKQTCRSPFPALNAKRRSEPVATDTVFSDTPAVNDGSKCAQVFAGTKTLVSDVYGMKSDKQFINSLQDDIRKCGAMDKLISDRAKAETSTRVNDVLRALLIDDWQSKSCMQHQSKSKNRHQTIKRNTNNLLNRTGKAPLSDVCFFVLNHAHNATIKNMPIDAAAGSACDIHLFFAFISGNLCILT